ncbi:lactate utilization protein C [candidate division TA06 bacterium B3_TA06]|uniref:Lactate utilization protein C n=1 Tax=candidate division TA06 bacterium B3_TA06 TaxID=2012487 RepID=A0A532V954_UNCT6|nr:MAG: lactate utilization protein C [candidate division TA06 bacterium B3_TA06]
MDASKEFNAYKRTIYKALKDKFLKTALERAVKAFRSNRDKALAAFPEVVEKRERFQEIKDRVIDDLEGYVAKAREALEKNHAHTYFAEDAQRANEILKDIIGTGKMIVKAKSITSEELEFNHVMADYGNTVYETDLGEFIVQLLGERPMHILAPAVHVPRERTAKIFSEVAGRELPADPEKLAMFAREFLRDKYFKADVGFSGANFITADTGTIFLVENEGNIRFATNAPEVHVAVIGVEKLMPTLADAMLGLEVLMRYAGYLVTAYVSMISGPAKTGDIEKVVVYGAHGPKELHVIFLDNGRIKAATDPVYRDMLRCLRCGACMYECAIYPLVSGHWGYRYMGGIGVPWTALISGGLEKAAPLAYSCALCGRCKEICPAGIDSAKLIERLRDDMKKEGLVPAFIREMAEMVLETGTPYPKED